MVSKVVKRTPTKSLKNLKNFTNSRRSRKKSPTKNGTGTASRVVASINKSLSSCHRRLINIFARLACIATPKKTPRKKGYQILQKNPANPPEAVRRALFNEKTSLPPSLYPEKKTIFLDLDEKVEFYVLKRPFVDEFLNFLSQKFEVVVFTAGIEKYASLVLDRLDWRSCISHRLYRDSCKEFDGKLVKDLSEIGRDVSRLVIVDDNPNSYIFQPDNAIPIKPFINDLRDLELKKLINFFEGCDSVEDMRKAVKLYIADQNQEKLV
ncbi:uncharacterized protein [Primulina eburnea]|uniref:uncharacterized protein n=1 Tax=Primulina eburnea TaxID=1245227 RepID=UPI003C6BFC68